MVLYQIGSASRHRHAESRHAINSEGQPFLFVLTSSIIEFQAAAVLLGNSECRQHFVAEREKDRERNQWKRRFGSAQGRILGQLRFLSRFWIYPPNTYLYTD